MGMWMAEEYYMTEALEAVALAEAYMAEAEASDEWDD